MSVREVVLTVSGGIVEPINIPPNTTVIIRDYDIVTDIEDETLLHKDENNKDYVEVIFERKN